MDSNIVPGVVRCAKCGFRLTRTTLYVRSGNAGPGNNESEPCPNGCGPLWPVTWRQEAGDNLKLAENYLEARLVVERERDELLGEREALAWNLGGISTIATSRKPQQFSAENARAALHDVNKMAQDYEAMERERDELRAEVERLRAAIISAHKALLWVHAHSTRNAIYECADGAKAKLSAALGEDG